MAAAHVPGTDRAKHRPAVVQVDQVDAFAPPYQVAGHQGAHGRRERGGDGIGGCHGRPGEGAGVEARSGLQGGYAGRVARGRAAGTGGDRGHDGIGEWLGFAALGRALPGEFHANRLIR